MVVPLVIAVVSRVRLPVTIAPKILAARPIGVVRLRACCKYVKNDEVRRRAAGLLAARVLIKIVRLRTK